MANITHFSKTKPVWSDYPCHLNICHTLYQVVNIFSSLGLENCLFSDKASSLIWAGMKGNVYLGKNAQSLVTVQIQV